MVEVEEEGAEGKAVVHHCRAVNTNDELAGMFTERERERRAARPAGSGQPTALGFHGVISNFAKAGKAGQQ